jgi:hypothetical protein
MRSVKDRGGFDFDQEVWFSQCGNAQQRDRLGRVDPQLRGRPSRAPWPAMNTSFDPVAIDNCRYTSGFGNPSGFTRVMVMLPPIGTFFEAEVSVFGRLEMRR